MEEKKKRYKETVARTEFIDEEDDNKDAKGSEVKENWEESSRQTAKAILKSRLTRTSFGLEQVHLE